MQIHELNTFPGRPGGTDFIPVDSGFDTSKISADNLLKYHVKKPLNGGGNPYDGDPGQLLRTKGDGSTEWTDVGNPTDAQTAQAVSDWLDAHPEATTTVLDNSLTYEKLVLGTLNFVIPEMFGAKGDGVTDDTTAIQNAINFHMPILLSSKTYKVSMLECVDGTTIFGNGENSKILSENRINIKCNDVKFSDFSIIGNAHDSLLNIKGEADNVIENITIEKLSLSYAAANGDEIAITCNYAENVKIENNNLDVGGVEFGHTKNFLFSGNTYNGHYINTNEAIHASVYTENGVIENNVFTNLKYEAIDTFSSGNRLVISKNVFDGFRATVIDIKVVLRDPPYTGGSSDQPEYGYTEFLTITNNIFTNLIPETSDSLFGVIQYYMGDERATPSADESNYMKYIIIAENQFSNMYPQNDAIASKVRYSCVRVYGSGSIISNNVFAKLYHDSSMSSYDVSAIQIGSSRSTENVIANDNVISNNVISGTKVGIFIGSSNRTIIQGNSFVKDTRHNTVCAHCIYIFKAPNNCIISNNIFYAKSGTSCIMGYNTAEIVEGMVITNNMFDGESGHGGVAILNSKYLVIDSNLFCECGVDLSGIDNNNSGVCNRISNNTFRGNGASYLIFSYKQEGLNIIGNMVYNYATFVRLLGDSKYCNISNNICKNVTTLKNIGSVTEALKATIQDVNNVSYS